MGDHREQIEQTLLRRIYTLLRARRIERPCRFKIQFTDLLDVLKTSESEMVMYIIAFNVDEISGRIFKAIV